MIIDKRRQLRNASHNREDFRTNEIGKYDRTYFEHHYWAEDLPGQSGNRGLSYDDPDHSKRFAFLSQLLLKNFQFDTCLDAGCGLGGLVGQLAANNKSVIGCEVSEYAVEQCRQRGVQCELAALNHLQFRDEQFDLVFCSDVLEHLIVYDVSDAVSELIRVTKHDLVLSINLDNPYEFHPTILSRDTWFSLFLQSGLLIRNVQAEASLQKSSINHPEYEWFCFTKI